MPAEVDNPNIKEGINQIVQAILDLIAEGITVNVTNNITTSGGGGCGGCSGGTGTVMTPFGPGSEVPGQEPGGTGPGGGQTPGGFGGTDEEYDLHKCNAANFVWDSIAKTFRTIGGLSAAAAGIAAGEAFGVWLLGIVASIAGVWAGVPAGAVIVTFFLTGWEIALIVAAIAALTVIAGSGVIIAFDWMADKLDDIKEDYICQLYDAQDVSEARSVMSNALTQAISIFSITAPFDAYDAAIRAMLGNIASYFISTGLLNSLFSDGGLYEGMGDYESPNPIGCEECDPDEEPLWQLEGIPGYPPMIVLSGNLRDGAVIQSGYVNVFGGDRDFLQISTTTHPENRYVKITSVVDAGAGSYHLTVYGADTPVIDFDSSDWGDLLDIEGDYSGIQIFSNVAGTNNPFEIEFNFTAP